MTKRLEAVNNLSTFNQLSTLSVIATSILSNNPNFLLQSMLANQVNINNYYSSFSRDQEREADIFAVHTLNKLRISSEPLKEFLKLLEKKSIQQGFSDESFKFSTHPVYKERYEIIKNISNNYYNKYDSNMTHRYNLVKAKLFGFTENNNNQIDNYLSDDYQNYAQSIFLSRNGKLKESLTILNLLIEKYSGNYFLIETKADLLQAHGYSNEAKKFYNLVIDNNNDNIYVKKRIFEIEYEQLDGSYPLIIENIFINFQELLIIFSHNLILQKKFKKIALYLDKEEWINFINANIKLINNENELALTELNKIIEISQDKKLINFAKKRLKLAQNE